VCTFTRTETQPHKEERFLFPAYPFIFIAAAAAADGLACVVAAASARRQGDPPGLLKFVLGNLNENLSTWVMTFSVALGTLYGARACQVVVPC
jgi:Alg9-like mannosyltransferase family